MYVIEKINWNIIGLSETKESKIEVFDEIVYNLFLSGNENSRSNGVGFLVNESCVPLVDDNQPLSDRHAILKLKTILKNCLYPTLLSNVIIFY